jgi:hypothetical protein
MFLENNFPYLPICRSTSEARGTDLESTSMDLESGGESAVIRVHTRAAWQLGSSIFNLQA